MNEEKEKQEIQAQTEEQKPEETVEAKPVEAKEETPTLDPIEEAKQTVKELREANAEMKKLVERNEKVAANSILAGRSIAHHEPPKEKVSNSEYAKGLMRGELLD